MKPSERGSKIDLQNGIHFLTTLSREPGRCKKKERERVPARPASPGRPGPDHGLSLFLFASARLSRQSSWKMNAILKVNFRPPFGWLHFLPTYVVSFSNYLTLTVPSRVERFSYGEKGAKDTRRRARGRLHFLTKGMKSIS